MSKVKVLIVDDHAMFREALHSMLERYDDLEIVGEAEDGREAVEKVSKLAPHVVLMDVGMPVMGGLEATRRIRKEVPGVKVVALTQHEDSEYILSMMRAGAKGYVAKTATGSELISAIRTVQRGDAFLYPSAASALVEEYLTQVHGEGDDYGQLSDREREVLQLVAEGRTSRQIADMLFISLKTVLRHRANTMEKLGLHNRTDLIKYAISKRLIEMPHGSEEIKPQTSLTA